MTTTSTTAPETDAEYAARMDRYMAERNAEIARMGGKIDAFLSIDNRGASFTPSQVARKVGTDTLTAQQALALLVRNGYAVSSEQGARSRYAAK
jgi:hypothetical protein